MKVLLIANKSKATAWEALEKVRGWLDGRGCQVQVATRGIFTPEDPELHELCASVSSCDLVCAFGGDGTILQAARIIGRSGVSLLGYNFGHLGFLAGATESRLIEAVQAAVDGTATLDERTMLEAEAVFTDGRVEHYLAFNEMVVSRGNFGRIISLDIAVNDHLIDSIGGDGLIVSTATGSTAYALSAGGPFISPSFAGLCIVPVSPHTLNARSIVTAPEDTIMLVPAATNRQRVVLFFDGELASVGTAGDVQVARILVRAASEKLRLLRFGASSFYDQIAHTFFRRSDA
ncbi:MAG: NAD(+)/NADH kinase [Coriobacteriales bacterium]|jgi:NAD+ kinase|nr:NAD(+)/NADH kinase [Coriobacteriales bacterium]